MTRAIVLVGSVPLLFVVLISSSLVKCEPPVRNSGGGWGSAQQQQQSSGGYSSGYSQQQAGAYSSGYSAPAAGGYSSNNGQSQAYGAPLSQSYGPPSPQYGAPAPAPQYGAPAVQSNQNNNNGWGQQQQAQVQSSSGNGGWGSSSGQQNQMKGGQGNGWGPQLNLELDTANLKVENLSPAKLIRSIFGIPRKIIEFIRDSGLYLLFIPLIIILPLMLLAFNFGRTLGGLKWGWGRSLSSTVESGIVGYLKSPVWQKIGETLMNEQNFDLIMKSIDEFKKMKKKNW